MILRSILQLTLVFSLLTFGGGTPANAQTRNGVTEIPDPQKVVKQVRLVSQSPTSTIFHIEFFPSLPIFQVARDLNDRQSGRKSFSITFEDTRRGPTSSNLRFKGLINNIEFSEDARDMRLNFGTTDPAKISATGISDTKIQITLSRIPLRSQSNFGNFGAAGSETNDAEDSTSATTTNATTRVVDDYGDDDIQETREFELIKLKYADVSEVVGLLTEGLSVRPNNTFIAREPGFGSPGRNENSGNKNEISQEERDQPLGESVDRNLAIDRRLNAIWVRGTREHIEQVKRQIELIDVPVDSVILETEFVELSETGSRNLGLELTNGSGQIGVASLRLGEFGPSNADLTKTTASFALQAALFAQIQKGEGRILSKPRISAQSGATAKIITGDALPILTAITLSGVNGVSQQVEYVNVGVTLQIAPRVSPDGYVSSKIYTVVSSVTGFSQGFPTISQREAETSASVRDGESFVIGGLLQESKLSTKSKIPILGDVPVLGSLFRRTTETSGKTELYIIITPRIVKHGQSRQ
jgi:general secretion pathway protein D